MKIRTSYLALFMAVCCVVVLSGILAPAAMATTATSLSSFEGEEEPVRIYDVQSGFRNDSYDNMTSPSSGTFRFMLRYRKGDWWDADRSTDSTDRQRAEVKGLGTHQKNNETFEYATTWRTNRGGSGSFWHVFQLKATNGDNGAPLIVNSIGSGTTSNVRYCSGSNCGFQVARSYSFSLNNWTTVNIRVKVATSSSGVVQAAVNGGSMSGKTGIAVYRPSATDYRPKWGSYRGVNASSPYGDDFVEHRNVSSNKR